MSCSLTNLLLCCNVIRPYLKASKQIRGSLFHTCEAPFEQFNPLPQRQEQL